MREAESSENLSGKPRVPTEKHDVLYSKARHVLNQRHIKRPWFNLNPFLEKTDDLVNWLPGESNYVKPHESLVLCESFHSEYPVDTRELSIDAFFPYLFSGNWSKCCSVRILAGQLLEQLLIGLYRLEKEGKAVRHNTYAFARNNRVRAGCYKFTEKQPPGSREETLLIEFSHFGRLSKEKPNPTTLDPFEYLQYDKMDLKEVEEKSKEYEKMSGSSVLEVIDEHRNRATSLATDSTDLSDNKDNKPKVGPWYSLIAKHVRAIGFIRAMQTGNRHHIAAPFIPECRLPSIAATQLSEVRQNMSLEVPSIDSGGSQLSFTPVPEEMRFLDRIYSLDLDDDDLSEEAEIDGNNREESSLEDCDIFFGEEFYLCDPKATKSKKAVSAKDILRQKKIELNKRRKEARRLQELQSEKLKQARIPLKFPLELENLDSCEVKYETIKMSGDVPTFEAFLKLLKKNQYHDARYINKIGQKSKKIAKRYYTSKGMHQQSVLFSCANLPDEIKNISTVRTTSRKTINLPLQKQESIAERSNIHLPHMTTLRESDRSRKNMLHVPDVNPTGSNESIRERAREVHGVTDSVPCKDHYLRHKGHSLYNVDAVDSPMFPKSTFCDEESESSDDTCSDVSVSETDSTDTDSNETFDTKKLNLRYSIERLRKKRRNKVKKKSAFIEILAKYYSMQNALRAFRQGSAGKETKQAMAMVMHLGKKAKKGKQNKDEMIIGKLRKFKFLDVKPKRKMKLESLSRGDFTAPDLKKFHQQLEQVLDQFVIRREVVVTDLRTSYNALTSVTFTKVSCFQHKDKRHQHSDH